MDIADRYNIQELASILEMSEARIQRRIYRFEKTLAQVPIRNKRILEIGAGDGIFSCLMSLAGAKAITSLEPQLSGHSGGTMGEMLNNIEKLGLCNVSTIGTTIQDYQAEDGSFDLIVSIASINHLDQDACAYQ